MFLPKIVLKNICYIYKTINNKKQKKFYTKKYS